MIVRQFLELSPIMIIIIIKICYVSVFGDALSILSNKYTCVKRKPQNNGSERKRQQTAFLHQEIFNFMEKKYFSPFGLLPN